MLHETIANYYFQIKNSADSRTRDWPLIREPLWVILLAAGYLFIVSIGPNLMQNRRPFELRKFMVVYNAFLVAISAWMLYTYFICIFPNPKFNVLCEPIREEDRSEIRMRLLNVGWWYFMSKIVEFADTFIFILRKKNNQISFLHIYHHSSMLIMEWLTVRYIPDGQTAFGAMLNCFVHVVMYGYYLLAAMGPHIQKYLWWKRYLTRLQMIQFVAIIAHNAYARWLDCGFPMHGYWIIGVYVTSLFLLFLQFYIASYATKGKAVLFEEGPLKEKVK